MAAVGAFIRAERSVARLSLRELADRAGVSNAYLSQVERGLHEPSIKVLGSIADGLGLTLGALLEEAGVLEDADAAVDTEAAIRGDGRLTEPERTALLSIYRSFVGTRR
jgi:transcriptional regulator with XRE-family HTH domain